MLKSLLLSSTLISLSAVALAAPITLPTPSSIYPGCQVPAVTGKTWYVSPLGNDATGDGTQAKPWTLKSITTAGTWGSPRLSTYPYVKSGAWVTNATAPVHPGDLIVLMPGNYGSFTMGVWGRVISNPEYVTFAADPPGKAVMSKVLLGQNISGIRVTGVTIRNDGIATGNLFEMSGNGSSNLMADHLDIATMEDEDSLAMATAADWETKVIRGGAYVNKVDCGTVVDNKIHSIATGIAIQNGNRIVASYNEIAYHNRDAINMGSTNTQLNHNFIHDVIITSTLHPDMIQGYGASMDGSAVQYSNGQYENIQIHGNKGFRQLDPRNKFAKYVQGIDAFDGKWKNVEISDNLIVTSSCWGVSWGSTSYGVFFHNTVLSDGNPNGLAGGCQPGLGPFTNTHQFPNGSDHVVAAFNIVANLNIMGVTSTVGVYYKLDSRGNVAVNNLILNSFTYLDPVTMKTVYNPAAAGVVQGNVFLKNGNPKNVFMNSNQTVDGYGPFDLHIQSGSPAIAIGNVSDISTALAELQKVYPNLKLPETDIEGNPFDPVKPTAGAYAYQPPKVCKPDVVDCIQPPPPPPICTTTPGGCTTPPTQ